MHKILFFGSSNYCLPALEALYKNFQLAAVITAPDKSVGRRQILFPTLPKQFSLSHNIKVYTPKTKAELLALTDNLSQMNLDLAVVSDYGLIIPQEIFTLPQYKTLNIHFSRLPQFRGPSPVQYTILTGQPSGWISIIIMDKEMDTGDIIWQKSCDSAQDKPFGYAQGKETSETLYIKLFNITARELPNVISPYIEGKIKPRKQDHSKATYTKLFTREDGFIPPNILSHALKEKRSEEKEIKKWSLSNILDTKYLILNTSISIERALRAFTPWPGVWTNVKLKTQNSKLKSLRFKIFKAHIEGEKLVLDLVQLEGKKPVSWKQFKEGYPDFSFA